ncbi:MAG TPA: hypothetical protein VNZ49_15065 [Bacteroidia bacterium]|nr:hypothetical protein [Bacteroidia bacterium]
MNGILCCVMYIVFLLLMQAFNLLHITQLRVVNYIILWLVCIYQVKKWITKNGTYVPFLQVLGATFFTGIWSFLLFSIFLFFYTRYNTYLAELFIKHTEGFTGDIPSVVILFEGSGVSIIVAFINMQYFRRYEEGETFPEKKPGQGSVLKKPN